MVHTSLEHLAETLQFAKKHILHPNLKENAKIKNIKIIKSEQNESNLISIGCHVCKEKVLVDDYASHCKEIHGIMCVIKKAEKKILKQFNE